MSRHAEALRAGDFADYQTPEQRLRFRDPRPARYDECGICGRDTRSTNANPFPKHDLAAHEVWAFETHGVYAVRYPARPFVEAWASGEAPLPSNAEIAALPRLPLLPTV